MASPLSSWARTLAKPNAARLLRPSDRHAGSADVPFPVVDKAAYRAAANLPNSQLNARIRTAPIEPVQLQGLVAIQHTVQPHKVQEYIDDPEHRPEGEGVVPTDYPIIVKAGGTRYVHDGHHRSVARLLAGDLTIPARYVDLDAER